MMISLKFVTDFGSIQKCEIINQYPNATTTPLAEAKIGQEFNQNHQVFFLSMF